MLGLGRPSALQLKVAFPGTTTVWSVGGEAMVAPTIHEERGEYCLSTSHHIACISSVLELTQDGEIERDCV